MNTLSIFLSATFSVAVLAFCAIVLVRDIRSILRSLRSADR